MNEEISNYDKKVFQKLIEKFLASNILSEDVFAFLKYHSEIPQQQLAKLITSKAGKPQNSIYKNTNELTNYSAISLLRYWNAMTEICIDFKIPSDEIPNLNVLITKYKNYLELINQIPLEHDLNCLVSENLDASWSINSFYSSKKNKLLPIEVRLLKQLEGHPAIKEKLDNKNKLKLERLREV